MNVLAQSAPEQQEVTIWNVETFKEEATQTLPLPRCESVALSADGQLLDAVALLAGRARGAGTRLPARAAAPTHEVPAGARLDGAA